ncbi:unnamed protein product, partial [Candidula unifasciata]
MYFTEAKLLRSDISDMTVRPMTSFDATNLNMKIPQTIQANCCVLKCRSSSGKTLTSRTCNALATDATVYKITRTNPTPRHLRHFSTTWLLASLS